MPDPVVTDSHRHDAGVIVFSLDSTIVHTHNQTPDERCHACEATTMIAKALAAAEARGWEAGAVKMRQRAHAVAIGRSWNPAMEDVALMIDALTPTPPPEAP